MRVVLTGGGTGGHVIPNFAVTEELRDQVKDLSLLYIGSKRGVEKQMVQEYGLDYLGVSCGKLRRYFSWENFVDLFRIPLGIWQAGRILRRFRPNVVFSKGGYVSLPVVMAASMLGIPVVAHESDLRPGLATRLVKRFVKVLCLSFEESEKYISGVLTGNPVRKMVLEGKTKVGFELTDFDQKKPVLLVMGGSQGARQVNNLIDKNLDQLLEKWQVAHIRGPGNLKVGVRKEGYKQYEYVNEDLPHLYAIAELVISRGGANSLAELAALGKKVLVIPLGLGGSRGEQIENAKAYVRKFGWVMGEGKDLVRTLELMMEGHVEKGEKNEAVKKIVAQILKVSK